MIDIYSSSVYPSNELSNFASHPFIMDNGVEIFSMEGFLQSLKCYSSTKQKYVCSLSGYEAKKIGKKKVLWKLTGILKWNNKVYSIYSDELQILIDQAFKAMYEQSPSFRQALLESQTEPLTHTIGNHMMNKTILTEYHFVRRLEHFRVLQRQQLKETEEKE